MKIAVLGTGANGAGVGADMARAGLDVTFIEQWPPHVDAIRERGIEVRMPNRTEITKVPAYQLCEVATLHDRFDLVFLGVKAYDTRWACELIKPLLNPDSLVVGLQNGMSVDDIADVVGPERTIGAVIEMASNMWEPGITNRQNPPEEAWFAVGSIHPATADRVHEVAAVLGHAGTVEVSDDIRSSKWMKLVVNAAELVPSALLNLELNTAAEVPGMYDFMLECGKEAVRAATASGSRVRPIFGMGDENVGDPDAFAEQLFHIVLTQYSLPDTKTTSLQDWLKGRRSEVAEINGRVVEELAAVGAEAPYNALVVELAARVEAGELRPAPENIELLLAPATTV
ncbi:2-dehydropantoate 2-reductase [Herbiconiux moechotypicola]|uniref:2-dehydropantoate 2-reductase n=1 Tax=Herbiconiux moechotypicola TaxID=637393 RepID=A0ABN3DCM2_9MICO|nr:2-dehydropantoate 2-reductase [Herbiconiux moechotypicola]MCS5728714.1 2-dehydropantoate 2-reductase [Herbiconiux moechotypicola]